jgi:multifunctional beta-oxidation protein
MPVILSVGQKCGIIGFSEALAREGARYDILVNTVAPVASTPGMATVIADSSPLALPEYCAPFVALLCTNSVPAPNTGGVYQIGGGWHARTRLQAGHGIAVISEEGTEPLDWPGKFELLSNFAHSVAYPEQENYTDPEAMQAHHSGSAFRTRIPKL